MGTSDKIALLALVISIVAFIYTFIVDRRNSHLTALEKKNKFLEEYYSVVKLLEIMLKELEKLDSINKRYTSEEIKLNIGKARKIHKETEEFYKYCTNNELVEDSALWESVMHSIFRFKNETKEIYEDCKKFNMEFEI